MKWLTWALKRFRAIFGTLHVIRVARTIANRCVGRSCTTWLWWQCEAKPSNRCSYSRLKCWQCRISYAAVGEPMSLPRLSDAFVRVNHRGLHGITWIVWRWRPIPFTVVSHLNEDRLPDYPKSRATKVWTRPNQKKICLPFFRWPCQIVKLPVNYGKIIFISLSFRFFSKKKN